MAWTKKMFINPPRVRQPVAIILFFVNIFVPGVGTIITAVLKCRMRTLIVGLLQLLTAPIVIGWLWSVVWGWALLKRSMAAQINEEAGLLDPYALEDDSSDHLCTRKTFIDPPKMHRPVAFTLAIVNVFFPGIGAIIAGITKCDLESLIVGILQLVMAPLVIGWAWSVIWGWELYQEAKNPDMAPPMNKGYHEDESIPTAVAIGQYA